MLCEGEKMHGEALRSGAKLKTVLVRDGWDSPLVKKAEEQGGIALFCTRCAVQTRK